LPTLTLEAVLLSAATIAVIVVLKKLKPQWPGMLVAVAAAAVAAAALHLQVATIGSQFGGIPTHPPLPALPPLTLAKIQAVLPSAISFALLGSIESLLSAVVADGMTGRRHRSNCELVAQGAANVASALFGGICATGTIARTATNVRAGAHGPIAGILHSAFLLAFMLVAAPLFRYIPLASLAGVLAVVAWSMVEKHAFATLVRASVGDAAVLLATFLLTIFRGVTEAIVVGFALGSVLFIHRMSRATEIATHTALVGEDKADTPRGSRTPYDETTSTDPNVVIYRITGALFFGAAASIGSVLDRIAPTHRALIMDLAAVPFVDSTAANTLLGLARKAARRHVQVVLAGTTPEMRTELVAHGLEAPLVRYEPSIEAALASDWLAASARVSTELTTA
jgi:SulP family sulfate permease